MLWRYLLQPGASSLDEKKKKVLSTGNMNALPRQPALLSVLPCFNGGTCRLCSEPGEKEVYSALRGVPAGSGKVIITTLDILCIKGIKEYTAPVDLDGMNESMNTFNTKSENRANVVGQQLLLNLLKEVYR